MTRASVFQNVRIVRETVAGTTPATGFKQLRSLEIAPGAKVEVEKFRPHGQKFNTVTALNKEWAEAKLRGMPTYDELLYVLAAVLENPTTTTPVGGVIARQHVFDPSQTAADALPTFSLEQGDASVRRHRTAYNIGQALTLKFARSKNELDGTWLSRRIEDGISFGTLATAVNEVQRVTITGVPTAGTFTLTFDGATTAPIAYNAASAAVQSALEALSTIGTGNVTCAGGALPGSFVTVTFTGALAGRTVSLITADGSALTGGSSPTVTVTKQTQGLAAGEVPLIPVMPGEINIYLADSYAGLAGASALNRPLSTEWGISDRQGVGWFLNRANASWGSAHETVPGTSAKLKLVADAEGMALLTTMRTNATKFMRIEAVGPTIEGAITYRAQIDTALRVTDVSEFSDEDGLFAIEWTFEWIFNATWGNTAQVTLINTTAAL